MIEYIAGGMIALLLLLYVIIAMWVGILVIKELING